MIKNIKGPGLNLEPRAPKRIGGVICQEEIEQVRWDRVHCPDEAWEVVGEPQRTTRRPASGVAVAWAAVEAWAAVVAWEWVVVSVGDWEHN